MCEGKRPMVWTWTPCKKARMADEGDDETVTFYIQPEPLVREEALPEDAHKPNDVIICQVLRCHKEFASYSSYEFHYNTWHRQSCSVCRRIFPTRHLRDLHLMEWHDSMFDMLAQKRKMYECLEEKCGEKFANAKERKEHLITIHKYPASLKFDRPEKTQEETIRQTSNHRRNKQETANPVDKQSSNQVKESADRLAGGVSGVSDRLAGGVSGVSDRLAGAVSGVSDRLVGGVSGVSDRLVGGVSGVSDRLSGGVSGVSTERPDCQRPVLGSSKFSNVKYTYKVPNNVCFGAGSVKGFQKSDQGQKKKKKHWHQREESMDASVNIENVRMDDLASALDI